MPSVTVGHHLQTTHPECYVDTVYRVPLRGYRPLHLQTVGKNRLYIDRMFIQPHFHEYHTSPMHWASSDPLHVFFHCYWQHTRRSHPIPKHRLRSNMWSLCLHGKHIPIRLPLAADKKPPCARIAIYKIGRRCNVSSLVPDGPPYPSRRSYPDTAWLVVSPHPLQGIPGRHYGSLQGLCKQTVRKYPTSPHTSPSKMRLPLPDGQAVHRGFHPHCPSQTRPPV